MQPPCGLHNLLCSTPRGLHKESEGAALVRGWVFSGIVVIVVDVFGAVALVVAVTWAVIAKFAGVGWGCRGCWF